MTLRRAAVATAIATVSTVCAFALAAALQPRGSTVPPGVGPRYRLPGEEEPQALEPTAGLSPPTTPLCPHAKRGDPLAILYPSSKRDAPGSANFLDEDTTGRGLPAVSPPAAQTATIRLHPIGCCDTLAAALIADGISMGSLAELSLPTADGSSEAPPAWRSQPLHASSPLPSSPPLPALSSDGLRLDLQGTCTMLPEMDAHPDETRWREIQAGIDLPVPVQMAFATYSHLPNHPRWAPWIDRVDWLDETLRISKWQATRFGFRFTWIARNVVERPPVLLEWESISGLVRLRGCAVLLPLPSAPLQQSRLLLAIRWTAPGWLRRLVAGRRHGSRLTHFMNEQAANDLRRFKDVLVQEWTPRA
eukprot:GHVT01045115.1.p1 GENE.GHVT01045115.1~~GHVT01045115.1.p1  ORF type:complete len:362 (-),score=75.03 GHVT01045115.1:501-1586(-)